MDSGRRNGSQGVDDRAARDRAVPEPAGGLDVPVEVPVARGVGSRRVRGYSWSVFAVAAIAAVAVAVSGSPLPSVWPVLLLGALVALSLNQLAFFPSEWSATAEAAVLVAAIVGFADSAELLGPLLVALLCGPLDIVHWRQRAFWRMAYNSGNRMIAALLAAGVFHVAYSGDGWIRFVARRPRRVRRVRGGRPGGVRRLRVAPRRTVGARRGPRRPGHRRPQRAARALRRAGGVRRHGGGLARRRARALPRAVRAGARVRPCPTHCLAVGPRRREGAFAPSRLPRRRGERARHRRLRAVHRASGSGRARRPGRARARGRARAPRRRPRSGVADGGHVGDRRRRGRWSRRARRRRRRRGAGHRYRVDRAGPRVVGATARSRCRDRLGHRVRRAARRARVRSRRHSSSSSWSSRGCAGSCGRCRWCARRSRSPTDGTRSARRERWCSVRARSPSPPRPRRGVHHHGRVACSGSTRPATRPARIEPSCAAPRPLSLALGHCRDRPGVGSGGADPAGRGRGRRRHRHGDGRGAAMAVRAPAARGRRRAAARVLAGDPPRVSAGGGHGRRLVGGDPRRRGSRSRPASRGRSPGAPTPPPVPPSNPTPPTRWSGDTARGFRARTAGASPPPRRAIPRPRGGSRSASSRPRPRSVWS